MQSRFEKIPERLQLLTDFLDRYERYWKLQDAHRETWGDKESSISTEEQIREVGRWLRRNVRAVESLVSDVDCIQTFSGAATFSPLRNFLSPPEQFYYKTIHCVIEMIEEAIGVYEHLQSNTGMISRGPSDLDLVAALERSLRVAFKKAPGNESEVQTATASLLTALAVPFTREQETVEVGLRVFKPDFVIHESMPLEVKLINSHEDVRSSQEEIAADIAAYKTKWSDLIFMVYDCGYISEPHRYKETLMSQFGVTVIIVKH